jgi:plasmid stabilization system protein ParE
MRYNLLVLKCAEIDIEVAFRFYLEISLELALRFEAAMDKAMGKLKRTPNNYFNLDDGRHRRIQVDGFPYMFIYEIEEDDVIIKMLFHQKNDPEIQFERLIVT